MDKFKQYHLIFVQKEFKQLLKIYKNNLKNSRHLKYGESLD